MYKCNVDYHTIIIANFQCEVVFIVFMERAILLQMRSSKFADSDVDAR